MSNPRHSNPRNSLLAFFAVALLAGTFPAVAGEENARVADAARFRSAAPIQNLAILKTRVVTPDTPLAFRLDETLRTSTLSTGERFRQLIIEMPLPQNPAQASTPRPVTDGRGR